MPKYVCIHGHFYQPPRENPWLEAIELQESALPFHDWNERITYECYAPNTASRILNQEGDIVAITNNYAKMSFNFGPTLLSWMEKHEPEVYHAILEADEKSRKQFSGHGSAMAQAFGHIILPIASLRDKHTQVLWGIRDFEHRFKRKPEGMWLPETAVDTETLEVLAEHGIRFTLLAPRQAQRVRKLGETNWSDVNGERIDTRQPYVCNLPSGRTIVLYFYHGGISQDVAFKGLLRNGKDFAHRFTDALSHNGAEAQLAHIATDGESYGHHHRHGDMALSYGIHYLETSSLARVTNYGEYLSLFPPTHEVEIVENSSWSCVHGTGRWQRDCGCNSGGHPGWHQAWREPLRQALDWLRDELLVIYERETKGLFKQPWNVRNEYIDLLLNHSRNKAEQFLYAHAEKELTKPDKIKAIKLLEMQRHAMLMYTSCGWFFDEISGIETIQVIQYASRAIQLAEEVSRETLEKFFVAKLKAAPSNVREYGDGAKIYEQLVKPARLDLLKMGVHYAVTSLFEDYPESLPIYSYLFKSEVYDRLEAGVQKMVIGMAKVHSVTTWEESEVSFAVLYLGQHTIIASAAENLPIDAFTDVHQQIRKAFQQGDVAEIIRLTEIYFGPQRFTLADLSKDEQRRVLNQIMQATMEDIEGSFRQIYEHNYHMMSLMNNTKAPLPGVFKTTVEFILNADLRRLFEEEHLNVDELRRLTEEINRWSVKLDPNSVGYVITKRTNLLLKQLVANPKNTERLRYILEIFKLLKKLPLHLDIWMVQNMFFSVGRQHFPEVQAAAERGEGSSEKWLKYFAELGEELEVRVG